MEKVGDECGTNLSSYSRKITENDVKRSESGGIRSGICNELNEKSLRQKIKWLRQLEHPKSFSSPQNISKQEDLSSKVANLAASHKRKKKAQTVISGVCTLKMTPDGTLFSDSVFLYLYLVNMVKLPFVTISRTFMVPNDDILL